MADALFYKYNKKGAAKYVPTPDVLEGPVADTHAHLDMLADPADSIARAAIWGVDFICAISDPSEKGPDHRWGGLTSDFVNYENIDQWFAEGKARIDATFQETAQATYDQRLKAAEQGNPFPDEPTADETMLGDRYEFGVKVPRYRLACGVHPHNARLYDEETEKRLLERLADPRTCAVGEVGLDYFYDLSPREVQKSVFKRQIEIAHETGLPLLLHIRDAHQDAYSILHHEGWPKAGVLLHCCSVGPDELGRWVEAGCNVAFGGAISFANSEEIRQSVKAVPAEALMVETDAPYMAPVPLRGVPCEPHFVNLTARELCRQIGYPAGEWRAALLDRIHANSLALLDREPTAWQVEHHA